MSFSDLRGRRVAIWGQGREGRAVAARCDELGIPYVVAEPDVQAGDSPGVVYDGAARTALLDAEVVVKSPGVPVTSPLYRELLARGVRVTSLTDLWMADHAARTIAVTGSKGKSTTASLLHHVLTTLGRRASLRGNIGTPVLEGPEDDLVVMELSSYQAQSLTRSPRVVVVTALFPEHLTWHGSEEAYYADKLNAVAHGPELVVTADGANDLLARVRACASAGARVRTPGVDSVRVDETGAVCWHDGTRLEAADLPLIGAHHAGNIALAGVVLDELGESPRDVAAAIATFPPLPHRMEPVPATDGRTWIDDSLATAPDAVLASLAALPGRAVAVVVGGADRGLDFTRLLDHLAGHPEVTLLLVGPTGARIHAESGAGRLFARFSDALDWARSPENPAEVVLLSPGAPSFDEFTDYEARSAAFRAAANR